MLTRFAVDGFNHGFISVLKHYFVVQGSFFSEWSLHHCIISGVRLLVRMWVLSGLTIYLHSSAKECICSIMVFISSTEAAIICRSSTNLRQGIFMVVPGMEMPLFVRMSFSMRDSI